MKKAIFTYDYGGENIEAVKRLGYDVSIVYEKDITNSKEINDAEVLVCYNPFETLDISKMTKLKWIQLSSIGIDQLPVEAVKASNIVVTNNRGGYSIPMGEWIVMSMLELLKHSHILYKRQLEKEWKLDTSILELYGKTVGFIGTGSIAKEAAKRLQGFDVEVLGVNTNGREVEFFNRCYAMENIIDMLSLCDVVVITIPSTGETKHLINCKLIDTMKRGAYLINVSRGAIVEEEALIEALKEKKVGGAALDVFEEEPLGASSPLWHMDNVIITPHNSWISERRNERRWDTIYKNMQRYINGEKLSNIVDINKGY